MTTTDEPPEHRAEHRAAVGARAALAALSVSHPDLVTLAVAWMEESAGHRRGKGLFGKIGASLIESADGPELHLHEETTFKAAGGGTARQRSKADPVAAALAWLTARVEDRRRHNATGRMALETEWRNGEPAWAKVIETTVISRPRLDAASAPR